MKYENQTIKLSEFFGIFRNIRITTDYIKFIQSIVGNRTMKHFLTAADFWKSISSLKEAECEKIIIKDDLHRISAKVTHFPVRWRI